jgi:hypothetical protein
MTTAPRRLQALGYLAGLFAAFSVGMWLGDHTRSRRDAWDHARDLDDIAQLASDLAEAEQAIESFPKRLQRAYDAGQAAMVERLTGLHAAESWQPVAPQKWADLMEARDNPEAN